MEIAKMVFDFRSIPQGFEYNEHYDIIILDDEGLSLELPPYFSDAVSFHYLLSKFRIME
jgi:hypothetical protein